jgi:hypothetical protein
MPYALGLANSPMLGGQADLWKQVQAKCGSAYVNSIQSAAGTDNAATGTSGASQQVGLSGGLMAAVAVFAGFFAALCESCRV